MSIIISSTTLILFVLGCYYLFNVIFIFTKKKTSDFFIQILPGWVLVLLISTLILQMYPKYLHGKQLIIVVFYTSLILCVLLSISIIFIKPFNKSRYYALIKKVKKDRGIH